ncbi:response regulator [Leptolyngbya sp. FACHB-16]|nr:response regulator [Leptolyngbya sp. FACHB-8]MBD2157594.1 response regulator [Leptolyngbya sp. FACHB-16]
MTSASPRSYTPTPKVLVVDDIADNRDLLKLLLESEGYLVETAAEGYTAIAKIEQQLPDLVILDLMMPDLDGYGVAQWVSQNQPFVPLLIVTGASEFPNFGNKTGLIADCIRKPIVFEELLEKVQAFITVSQNHKKSKC